MDVMNSKLKYNTMKSEKNKILKLIGGHKFRFHKILKNDIERWCRIVKTCKCFLKFNSLNSVIESVNEHNHEPLPEKILSRQKFSNNLKRKAVDDMFTRPSSVTF